MPSSPTTSGLACDHTGKPYVVDCDYDQAGELLAHIYGQLNAARPTPDGHASSVFDQQPFTEGPLNHGLSDGGVVYVPPVLRRGRRLPRPHRLSRLRAEPRRRRRRLHHASPASPAGPIPTI